MSIREFLNGKDPQEIEKLFLNGKIPNVESGQVWVPRTTAIESNRKPIYLVLEMCYNFAVLVDVAHEAEEAKLCVRSKAYIQHMMACIEWPKMNDE